MGWLDVLDGFESEPVATRSVATDLRLAASGLQRPITPIDRFAVGR